MNKIRVTVILHDKRKGEIEIDPGATLKEIKSTIVADLELGEPKDYILAVADKEQESISGNVVLQDGDFMFLIQIADTKQRPVSKNLKDKFK